MKKFKRKVWLNKKQSASTGSIVVYDGESPWAKGKTTRFIEVSSCDHSARLHMTNLDTRRDWVRKVKKLTETLQDYLEFLER